jgi:hypothetical protein
MMRSGAGALSSGVIEAVSKLTSVADIQPSLTA